MTLFLILLQLNGDIKNITTNYDAKKEEIVEEETKAEHLEDKEETKDSKNETKEDNPLRKAEEKVCFNQAFTKICTGCKSIFAKLAS